VCLDVIERVLPRGCGLCRLLMLCMCVCGVCACVCVRVCLRLCACVCVRTCLCFESVSKHCGGWIVRACVSMRVYRNFLQVSM